MVFLWLGRGTFFFFVGGAQDFGVRTRRRIRPMDIPALPWSRRLLGTLVFEPDLGQKPKLGGVRILLPSTVLSALLVLIFLKFLPVLLCLLICKNPKRFILSFG